MGRYEQALSEVRAQEVNEAFQKGEASFAKKVMELVDKEWTYLEKNRPYPAADAVRDLGQKIVGLIRDGNVDLRGESFKCRVRT